MTASRRWDLLALGDPCADLVVAVDALPAVGGKVLARALGDFSGGTTANAACAFSRLGGQAAVFGRVGDDAWGASLRDSLQEDGVDVSRLLTSPGQASGRVIALIPPGGDRALVVIPMAPGAPRDDALAEAACQARVLYAMPYDLEELRRVRRIADRAGSRIAIDLEAAVVPDAGAMAQRLMLADIAFFNREGFVAATGGEPTPEALTTLLDFGPSTVVVSLGSEGAIAADRQGTARQAAFRVPAVDTTGAGDTFNAAFLISHLEGQPLAACLRFACAAAGLAVGAVGARTGMPDRQATLALMASTNA